MSDCCDFGLLKSPVWCAGCEVSVSSYAEAVRARACVAKEACL